MKTIKLKSHDELPYNFTGISEYPDKHSAGVGIAYIYWVDGKRHRTDGPAIEWNDGGKQYFANNKLHRIDGPACEYPNGTKFYFIHGKKVTKEAQELLCDLMKLKDLVK